MVLVGRVCRLTAWVAAPVVVVVGFAVGSSPAAAATAPPTEMRFACVARATGMLSYAPSAAACARRGAVAVAFHPGAVQACVRANGRVRRITTAGQCRQGEQRLRLPQNARTYFCAELSNGGMLRRVGQPSRCAPVRQRAVFVVNHAPTAVSLSSLTVPENQPGGTLVGRLAATDPDQGARFTFALVNGDGGADNAAFRVNGAGLELVAAFDYERRSSHSVRLRVTDQWGLSVSGVFAIVVSDVNEAPTDVSVSPASVAENQPAGATVGSLSATDPDGGESFTYSLIPGTSDNDYFRIDGSTLVTNRVLDFEDTDGFGVYIRASDRGGLSFERVLTVRVSDVAEGPPPVPSVSIGDVSLAEGNIGVGTALFTVSLSPASAQPVTVSFTTADGTATTAGGDYQSASGTLSFAAGETSKTIGVLVNGDTVIEPDETFTVTLSSPVGAAIADGQATGTITNDDANAAPVAADDSYSVAEDGVLTVAAPGVLANDTDADGDTLTAQLVSGPADGTLAQNADGSFTYTPDADTNGPDSFTYRAADAVSSDTATVSITVTAVNDAPLAAADSYSTDEDAALTVPAPGVLANDLDADGDTLSAVLVAGPAVGTLTLDPAGSFTYTPPTGFSGPVSFTYQASDGALTSATASVTITVAAVNDPPVAAADTYSTAEDTTLTVAAPGVLGNDTDADGDALTAALGTGPTHGTLALAANGSFTYTPAADYSGPDSFTYTATDGQATSAVATVSLTVTAVDDPPVAVNDSATVLEEAAATAVPVLSNDTDVDGGTMTIGSASDPANGTVVVTGGGTGLTYQPDPNYCNAPPGTTPDTFTYTLNGGSTATVSVAVTCVPEDPVVDNSAGNTSYTENGPATAIDSAVTVTDPDPGTTITGATVQIIGGYAGAQDILALASPGSHPGITASVSGDTLTLTGDASPAAYQGAFRDVTYRNSSESPSTAARTVTFTVTDATARTGSDTKGLTVVAVDDPPVAVNDSATVLEEAAATAVPVLSNDTDVDGGTMTIGSASDPANGTVVVTGGGTGLTYQPDPNYCNAPPGTTPDTFTYTLNGGSTATVSVTVTCVNDPPVADDETFNGANGAIGNTALVVNDPDDPAPNPSHPKKTISGDILAGDTDVDGPGPLTVTPGTFATNDGGSVTIESDGDFTFHPAASTSCTDTSDFFTYTVEDSGSPELTDTGQVTIVIAGCVWYVSNNATGNSGTSSAPFDTLAQAETASGANHTVFVFDGDNTSTGYGGDGYALNAGERLIGEHEGLQVDPDGGGALGTETLHPANPGAHPTLTATNADVIDLDDGNELRGLNVDPQGTGGGVAGGAGDTGGGTIDDVNILDGGTAGTQAGLELNGTTGTFNITNVTVNNSATGVLLTNAGTTDFGTTTITSTGAPGLVASGTTNMSTSTFDAITVTGSGNGGVSMTNTTGTTTFGALSLTTTSGAPPAFLLSNAGTVTVSAAGTANVSATGGPAVDVTGTVGATLAFDAVSSTNSANDGINLAGLGTGTFSAASGSIGGAAGIVFDLDGGSGTVSYPGALNNGSGQTVEITGRSGGAVTFSGPIADTNDAGGGITVSGNTGGSTTFSNASKVINSVGSAAVSFTGSDGHTLTFSGGGLDIDATSGAGINATDSGTLTVSGAGNSVATTTGTAVNVSNTDFGAATFQSISANGAASGIVLNNTGTTAGLTVTGGGSTTQGGDNSGGTIQNTTGHGISLTNTTSASFRNMHLQNTGNSGVNGTQVNGFSFTDGRITGAGDASDENSITFDDNLTATPNLTGAVTITNNVISQTEAEGIDIQNFAGTISDANISTNALSDTGDVATPGSAISLLGSGTPTSAANILRATIANNTIVDFRAGAGVQVRAGNPNVGAPTGSAGTAGSATNVIAITGNSMNGGNGGIGNQPDRFFTGGVSGNGGQGNFNLSNNGTAANRIRMIDCIAIELQADGPVTMTSTVQNNFINANSAVGCAGIAVGTDDPSDLGAGTHSTLISGNNVMGTDGPGIFPIVRDSGSTMTARVINNTVAAPIATNAARAGIRVDSGSAQGDTTLCLEISGNTTAGSTNTATSTTSPGINLRKQGTDPNVNTFGIEGMAATASPGVENFVNALNTSTSGTFGVGGTALLSAASGFTSCTAP